MLCRCKGKSTTNYVRCISIPASHLSFPRATLPKDKQREDARKEEEEVWNNVLKSIPTPSSKWRSLAGQRRRNAFNPDFFSSRRFGQTRKYTTDVGHGESSRNPPFGSKETESLFDSSNSAWEHVFENIDELPPLDSMPVSSRPRSTVYTPPGIVSAQRQTMTAREIDVFNNMFNMIFDAAKRQKQQPEEDYFTIGTIKKPRTAADRRADKAARLDPLSGVGIGDGPDGTSDIGDLFGKLRRVSRQFRWSPREDAELERKLSNMELCDTDQQLLEWAAREVFDESARYEEAARQAVYRAETSLKTDLNDKPEPEPEPEPENKTDPTQPDPASASTSASTADTTEPSLNPSFSSPLPLQPPAYPHLLAALIRTFRDKFHDPHLALSIFNHARSRSIASFVFGCTAPAYNELLRTRWEAFHDLRGFADALQEMRVNGVIPDAKTRELVEEVRREAGSRTVWQEERNIGTGEALDLITRIETLSREPQKQDQEPRQHQRNRKYQNKRKSKPWRTSEDERWKSDDGKFDKHYKFGDWKLSSGKKSSKHTSSIRQKQPSQPQKLAFE